MSKSAIYCNHANEMPATCPCDDDCYCKEHSCKSRKREMHALFKIFTVRRGKGHASVCKLLTELGPDKVISVMASRYYKDLERVTVWYWADSLVAGESDE